MPHCVKVSDSEEMAPSAGHLQHCFYLSGFIIMKQRQDVQRRAGHVLGSPLQHIPAILRLPARIRFLWQQADGQ